MRKAVPPVPLCPLFAPTVAKPFKAPYERSSYLMPCSGQYPSVCGLLTLSTKYSQPSIPPFPVAKKRPDQFSGNHASNDIFEVLDVFISSVMRQRSTDTFWLARLQLASLSGKVKLVPAVTYWRTLSFTPVVRLSGLKARHSCSKPADATAT